MGMVFLWGLNDVMMVFIYSSCVTYSFLRGLLFILYPFDTMDNSVYTIRAVNLNMRNYLPSWFSNSFLHVCKSVISASTQFPHVRDCGRFPLLRICYG